MQCARQGTSRDSATMRSYMWLTNLPLIDLRNKACIPWSVCFIDTVCVTQNAPNWVPGQVQTFAGTPEAIGKAELLDTIARGMNRWQGFSIGLSKQLAWLDGSLHKRQAAIHQVMESAQADELNFILAHNNCANLLEVAAEKTINLLTDKDQRLRDLNVLSR